VVGIAVLYAFATYDYTFYLGQPWDRFARPQPALAGVRPE
jgi:hypothetical protein